MILNLPFPKLPLATTAIINRHAALSTPVRLPATTFSSSAFPIEPAFANANIFNFTAGYNVQILVDEGESEEALLRRFRREVSKAGVIQECKRRKHFENKQEEKKRKLREAGKRNRRRRLGPRFSPTPQVDADAAKKAKADDDDNWDLPQGGLPF